MHGSTARTIWKLFQLLPINKKLILFESEPDFCDNSWALYQYLLKERPNYHFVWIVQNPHNYKGTNNNQTSYVSRFGQGMHLKTIFYYATARFNFYTHWTFRSYIPRKGQTVINLWHGTGVKDTKIKSKDYFDWLLTTGEAGIIPLSTCLGTSVSKTLPLGYPRNDILLNNVSSGKDNPFCPKGEHIKKIILWLPTFRTSINEAISEKECDTVTGFPLLDTQKDLVAFNEILKEKNVVVIAKIHHLQAEKPVFQHKFSNFIILTDKLLSEKGYQLYHVVGKSDALLTDYSSIMVNYLLVNKPMGFILDDLEKYEKSRGLLFNDVRKVMMGDHIFTKEHLYNFVDKVVEEIDEYKALREAQVLRVHNAADGTACKNIVDYFGI